MPPSFIFKKNEGNINPHQPLTGVTGANIGYDLERVTFNKKYLEQSNLEKEGDHWKDDQGVYYPHPAGFEEYGCTLGWFRDCPYPLKGFPFPQALYAVNVSKRIFLEGMKIPGKIKWYSPISFLTALLDFYTNTARRIVEPFLLSESNYSPLSGELWKFIETFLKELGVNADSSRGFAEVFSFNIQSDNAYYLRIEDLLSETTKEDLLKNPTKEMKRLIGISYEREEFKMNADKFSQASKILRFLFWIPRVKRSFKKALQESEFENFQWDESDVYHTLLWGDYKFRGIPIEIRQQDYINYHTKNPPFPPRRYIQ